MSILDLSDEENPACKKSECPSNKIACSNKYCLDIEKFCDGVSDCDNDEVNCPASNSLCLTINCSYDCKVTPSGPMCYCGPGYRPNGTQCDGTILLLFT